MLYFDNNSIKNGEGNELWRFLKNGETNDSEFDIWNIMKSKTMKEYYKNNIKLSIGAMINIIAYSYISINAKIEYLNLMKNYYTLNLPTDDKAIIDNCINYLNYTKDIFTKDIHENKFIYLIKESEFICNKFICNDHDNFTEYLSEYIKENGVHIANDIDSLNNIIDHSKSHIIYIEAYYRNNMKKAAKCTMFRKVIVHLQSFCNEDLDDNHLILYNAGRYYIPYKNGDTINISIPEFNHKISGYIEKDLSDDWYTFFYGNNTNNCDVEFDISSVSLDFIREYSIFDIIE